MSDKLVKENSRAVSEGEKKLKDAGFRVSMENDSVVPHVTLNNPDLGVTITLYPDSKSDVSAAKISTIHYTDAKKSVDESIVSNGNYKSDSKNYEVYQETLKKANFTAGELSDFFVDYCKANWKK